LQTQQVVVDREEARALFRKYRTHQHYAKPVDLEIQRTYQLIAQGRIVIRALAGIAEAGVGEDGYPKLAICRADAERCFLEYRTDGSARMAADRWPRENHRKRYIDFRPGTFPPPPQGRNWSRREAILPIIPIDLRPKRGLENYHVLWEAVWQPAPPVDPMLLRRIGEADLWVVCAAWELTEVERAVLAARI
jgi:hypothetical protein